MAPRTPKPWPVTLRNPAGPGFTTAQAPAAWAGDHLAVTPPPGADRLFATQRGQWVITHRSGFAAAHLRCSQRDAVALARAWDSRFESMDPADVYIWPHRLAWGNAVKQLQAPQDWGGLPAPGADDGGSTDTALELAARAGVAIDRGGAAPRIRWRGRWYLPPTDAMLRAWTLDSCCETPDGRTVEPDHPESWLCILGLV